MKTGAPWSIKGIEREAREAAKIEARKSGKTLGQWLNKVIIENAEHKAEDSDAPADTGPAQEQKFDNDVHATLSALASQLARLAGEQDAQDGQDDQDHALEQEGKTEDDSVMRALRDLAGKFEQSERQTSELMSEFKDDLNLISHYIHPPMPAEEAVAQAQSDTSKSSEMKTLEEALTLVVDHIELTDRRNGDILKSIQQRLSQIGARMNSITPGSANENEIKGQNRITQMEKRVAQLAAMLNQQADHGTAKSYRVLEDKIARLNQDMQFAMQRARSVNEDPEFTALKDKIRKMSQQVSSTQAQISNPPHLKALHDQISALSQGLEEVKTAPGPDQAIETLHERYEELAGRLHETERHIPDIEQVNAIEERLQSLAGRLDRSLEDNDPHPQLLDLESRVNELAAQLESAREQSRWDDLLPKLDAKFAQINTRLGQTEEKFKVLDGFEERISQLFKGLDQARETAAETARQAADQAAQQVAKQMAQQATAQAVQQASRQAEDIARKFIAQANDSNRDAVNEAAELAAARAVAKLGENRSDDSDFRSAIVNLEKGLDDVRANTDTVERRTQETLKTVHESLEKVVERLSGLEDKVEKTPEKDEASLPPSPPPEPEDSALRLPPVGGYFNEAPGQSGDARGLNDSLEQIYGAPQGTGYSPTMESSYPDGEAMGGVNRNEDFIAAARRAAQTAAQIPSYGDEAAKASLTGKDEGASGLGSFFSKNRKSLLYAGVAILALGGIYMISGMFAGSDETPAIVSQSENAAPAEPAKELAAAKTKAPAAVEPAPAPSVSTPAERPIAPLASAAPAPGAGADNQPAANPDSTNSIPPQTPAESTPTPLHMALGNVGGSTVKPKTTTRSGSTGNLPAALGPEALRSAAVAGNPTAQYEIAHRYATGKGVKKDMGKARAWYQKAAARGFAMAQYRLGTLYEKGQGVKKDLASARIWYKRAAGKGNRKAMHNLAVLNAEGGINGNKPDFKKAAQWFRKAAELGLTDSQFNLAILSERGLGVPQSRIEAYKWFSLAARNGDKDATNRLETIANQMDSKTLVKARLAVKSWKPAPVNLSANRIAIPAGGWQNARAVTSANATVSELIMQTQSMLMALGYKPGSVDGVMGGKTRQAIMKFQSNEGLAPTGEVTPDLVVRLKAALG